MYFWFSIFTRFTFPGAKKERLRDYFKLKVSPAEPTVLKGTYLVFKPVCRDSLENNHCRLLISLEKALSASYLFGKSLLKLFEIICS
jgi:hypothetical protein